MCEYQYLNWKNGSIRAFKCLVKNKWNILISSLVMGFSTILVGCVEVKEL